MPCDLLARPRETLSPAATQPPSTQHLLSQLRKVLARLLHKEAQLEDGAVKGRGGVEHAALQVATLRCLNVAPEGDQARDLCVRGDTRWVWTGPRHPVSWEREEAAYLQLMTPGPPACISIPETCPALTPHFCSPRIASPPPPCTIPRGSVPATHHCPFQEGSSDGSWPNPACAPHVHMCMV